jgi:leucyl aminopeptidase (aminopeptidase T)
MGREGEPYLSRRNCAEFGVGLNPNATHPFTLLEAEKIRGTVHIAVGDNAHFGRKTRADLHQDFVIFQPTPALDAFILIAAGQVRI